MIYKPTLQCHQKTIGSLWSLVPFKARLHHYTNTTMQVPLSRSAYRLSSLSLLTILLTKSGQKSSAPVSIAFPSFEFPYPGSLHRNS